MLVKDLIKFLEKKNQDAVIYLYDDISGEKTELDTNYIDDLFENEIVVAV
jgi:hypothetical protein